MSNTILEIKDLSTTVGEEKTPILRNVDLSIEQGETHIIMGPNGAGKSTLGFTIMGSPIYEVESGSIKFEGEDITDLSADKRALRGIYLSFQNPIEVPGISMRGFLRSSLQQITGKHIKYFEFNKMLEEAMELIDMDPSYADRDVNVGFSGGEKKKAEILQLLVLKPKMLAPMGIGVLYGKKTLLERMDPFLLGGEMIEYVTREDATYAQVPHKFEAGTVNAGGAVGLACACDYISGIGFDFIKAQEDLVSSFILEKMNGIPEITVYGSSHPEEHHGIISFNVEGCHPHDVASILNEDHICVRAGHRCAQPLMQYMGIGSCVRASVYAYNTVEEAEAFMASLSKVRKVLGY